MVYERVFGVGELGSPELVSPSTLFMIGSTTKSMTTMMEASLVDSGRLSWDTRLTTLWPSFAVGDAELTQQLEVWHSSCMCTGVRTPDLEYLFEYENVTPEARIASLREVSPTAALQERSMYSNLMAAAGGYVAAQAFAPGQSLGEAYTAAMQATVFTPIGMSSTTLDFAVVARREHASPHALAFDGTTHALPVSVERNVIAIAPAGAVWSNLEDMERFVHTELNGGVAPSGRQVVSRKSLLRRRKASVRFGKSGHYGLGVILSTVGDFPSVGHDGGSLGFGTTMRMLPKHRLGSPNSFHSKKRNEATAVNSTAFATRRLGRSKIAPNSTGSIRGRSTAYKSTNSSPWTSSETVKTLSFSGRTVWGKRASHLRSARCSGSCPY